VDDDESFNTNDTEEKSNLVIQFPQMYEEDLKPGSQVFVYGTWDGWKLGIELMEKTH